MNLFWVAITLLVSVATSDDSDPVETFRKLFKQKRVEQLSAVHKLQTLDYEKQIKLLDPMLGQIAQILSQGKARLEASGIHMGVVQDFPEDQQTQNALALVLENVCFLSDILLRFPDFIHAKFASQAEWQLLYKWGLSFALQSQLVDAGTIKMLDLAAQEVGVKEKDPEYVNPYRLAKQKQKKFEDPPPKKKKEKKKMKRGPRMSKTEL